MTEQDAHQAAIEFVGPVVATAVLHALTEDGMRSLEPKAYVRPEDPLDGRFSVEVQYGSRRQYMVRGIAQLNGFENGWTSATINLTGSEMWRITATRSSPEGEPAWTIENRQ